MPPTIIQSACQSALNEFGTISTFVNVVLGQTPTPGNLLVAAIGAQTTNFLPSIPGFSQVLQNVSGIGLWVGSRVVQAGDSKTWVCTALAGADWCSAAIYEVGNSKALIDNHGSATNTDGSPLLCSVTPNFDGSLPLLFATANGASSLAPTVAPGTWVRDQVIGNNPFHPIAAFSDVVDPVVKGTPVAPTMTWPTDGGDTTVGLVLIEAIPVSFGAPLLEEYGY